MHWVRAYFSTAPVLATSGAWPSKSVRVGKTKVSVWALPT